MRVGGTTHCMNCGQPISRYARTCPRCGAPQPHKRIGSSVGLVGMLLLLAIVILWAFIA